MTLSNDMTLQELLAAVPGSTLVSGDASVVVNDIHYDSRAVRKGDVFVAVRGRTTDGHNFVDQAVANGASAVVVETDASYSVATVRVPDGAQALGLMAAARTGQPSQRLQLIGITGTNGKTTTSFLLESILKTAGHTPAVLGTVDYRWKGQMFPAAYTTPPAPELLRTLERAASDGCTHGVLEVSSAALEMKRLVGTEFGVAAFSNLTQDHLDVHGTMEAYRDAKALLFEKHLKDDGVSVINIDDAAGAHMASVAPGKVLRVSSRDERAEIYVTSRATTLSGLRTELRVEGDTWTLECPVLYGQFNVENVAIAAGVAHALGISGAQVAKALATMPGVPGRLERVENDHGLHIFVDYAHTPDALENVLDTLRPLTAGRLLCVFGCGGDRDAAKRPLMGAAVAERADLTFVTSDNPRTEAPQAIIDAILPSVPNAHFVDTDRATAICAAVHEATPNDIVLIAGKGHEDYQIIGTEKIHFDDREQAQKSVQTRQNYPLKALAAHAHAETSADANISRIVIDSRQVAPGDLYVSIVGERLDGHEFCRAAAASGAKGVVVRNDRAEEFHDLPCAVVSAADPREALGHMAGYHRTQWGGFLVAITGSSGKTTCKELTAVALSAGGRVHKTLGSFNNETGMPLMLLRLRAYHDYSVVEMGMRGLGQIDYLCQFAQPDVGVVVNAGVAHIGVLGSKEAIVEAKSEVFPAGKTAIYPAGDERLSKRAARAAQRITFGPEKGADVQIVSVENIGAKGLALGFNVRGRSVVTELQMIGDHNALNAACALAVALSADVDVKDAAAALRSARPPSLRGELAEVDGRCILIDCYNANPDSMAVALRALSALQPSGNAVAVMGDMLELGDEAETAHRDAGRLARDLGLRVVALGEHAKDVAAGAGEGATVASTHDDAARKALDMTAKGDWILLKASRGMQLERVLEAMKAEG